MNILIPHTWLLEHLDTDATPEEIQKFLSLCGPSIERIYEKEGEAVYDIEVTTNRVDCMSVRGIAREAAVILHQFGKKGKLKPLPNYKAAVTTPVKSQLPLPKVIDKEKLCKRTMGVVLAETERTATPEWMAKRLRQIDVNVHDAVIDITNYVTHDLGHPCHAFDYDRLMSFGGTIIIKQAAAGKKFVTLDNAEYTTVGGEVVFENEEGIIIDLPGIKGTANTSINAQTKNVLLWIENTDAKKIRFGSMTHAIRTVAAQLNEKNVDPALALPVLHEGMKLFLDLTSAKVASTIYDSFPGKKDLPVVKVKLARISEYLGVELPLNTIDKILTDLGCDVDLKSQQLHVTPPSFRPDIEIPADVIEEIARIYGYHNLPSVLMPTAIPLIKPTHTNFFLENRIKRFLSHIGWQEVYTYSMVSEQIALESGYGLDEHLKIQNPLTDDRVYMRRSLVPSLEEIISQNTQRTDLSIFEIANIYEPQAGDLPLEDLQLAMVSAKPFRTVKGEVEALLHQFFIDHIEITIFDAPMKPYTQIGIIKAVAQNKKHKSVDIGTIGVLTNSHVAIVFNMKNLISVAETHPTYQPLPKTSEVMEDLTFVLPAQTAVGPMIHEMKKISPFITRIKLKDVYGQNHSFSLTYYNPQQNLTAEDVTPIRKKIVETLEKKFTAQLVGKLE
jgi:phenylalanyl-tRNA synthetase beta chain